MREKKKSERDRKKQHYKLQLRLLCQMMKLHKGDEAWLMVLQFEIDKYRKKLTDLEAGNKN